MHWLRARFVKGTRAALMKGRRPSISPRLEVLEDRLLPSNNPVLATPVPIGPSGFAPADPILSWKAVPGALLYEVTVVDEGTQQVVIDHNLHQTSYTLPTALTVGGVYAWQVQATDFNSHSAWSSPSTFYPADWKVPTLLAPTDVATTQPTFSWTAVSGSHGYTLSLTDQTTGQAQQISGVPYTTWTPSSPLTLHHTYEWAVQGDAGMSSGMQTFFVSELTAPTLSAPGATATSTRPVLSWKAVTGGDHYDIWILDQLTGALLENNDVVGTSIKSPALLTPADRYSWQVRAFDSANYAGPWSNLGSFTVVPLGAPTLLGPSNSAVPLSALSWNAVTGALKYDVWVQDRRTGQVLRNQAVTGTNWVPSSPLNLGDTYDWWVRGIDADNIPGPWSSSLAFTVFNLAMPTGLSPNGLSSTLPTFTWNAVAGAGKYDIWVQDRQTGQVLRNQAVIGASWTPSSPLNQGDTYDWWVRGIDGNGKPGPWSSGQSLNVRVLAAPGVNSPSGPISVTLPTFTWSAVPGATHYDIWVQQNGSTQILRNQNVTGTTWAPAQALTLGVGYTWWVRALDGGNSPGPWSDGTTFTVYALPAPLLIGPSGSTASTPTFSWKAVTSASHYDIYVEDMNTGQVLRNTNVTGTSWSPSAPLVKGDSYEWWVRAITSTGLDGIWSDPLSLSVTA
jgi:hypothetical protein